MAKSSNKSTRKPSGKAVSKASRTSAAPEPSANRRVRIRSAQRPCILDAGLHHTNSLSRAAALGQAVSHLRRSPNHPAALALIDLFQLDGEELLEAGACYETVAGLQRRFPLLGSLN